MTTYEALYSALTKGDSQSFATLLLDHPECLKAPDGTDFWFGSAAMYGNVAIMEFLLSQGLSVDISPDSDPEGPIVRASSEGRFEATKWLLDHRATVNHIVDGQTRCFALTSAIVGGHLEVVKLLVHSGADVNAPGGGMLPLEYAYAYGHPTIAEYLLSVGAKPSRR